ncbi:MAG: hypothetical protein J1G04_03305 [Clostridiales bacterium]|nr:hypothetical protein [Clostridiales bacterium]
MSDKRLYYEITEDEKSEETLLPTEIGIEPTRDYYRELISAAKKIERARFRVKEDDRSNIMSLTLITFAIVIVGSILLYVSKSKVGSIVIAAIMITAVAVAVASMIVFTVRGRKEYYCYYFKTDDGPVCISFVGGNATIFVSDRAYRIEGENSYTFDARTYIDYLDGEGTGILSVLTARESDVQIIDENGIYRVKNRVGGGHDVIVEDGEIVGIASMQPYKTDVVDGRTGEAAIKTKLFEKTTMTDDFTVELPDEIKSLYLSAFNLDVDALIGRLTKGA